jgi:hypothetical protein
MSAFHPIATKSRTSRPFGFGPFPTKCTATKCRPFRRLANNDEERRQQTDKLVADLRYGFFTSAAR